MRKTVSLVMAFVVLLTIVFSFTGAQTDNNSTTHLNLTVSADNISYALSENLYGLSLDDMGYALNGGLVADLVNNNSFEQTDNPTANWLINGVDYSIANENAMNENNPNYLNVTVDGKGTVKNIGYSEIYNNKSFQFNSKKSKSADMGFLEDEAYLFSAFFKNIDYVGTMTLSLEAEGNTEKYQFNIDNCTDWTKVSLEIKSNVTADGALRIDFEGKGSFYMDSASLVPTSSYGYGSENWQYTSLRQDLVDAIKELSPSFIRFSENTYTDIDNVLYYDWTDSLGSLETRKQITQSVDEDRVITNSNAMGFYEYLVICEELNASPVPVFNVNPDTHVPEYLNSRTVEETPIDSEETTEETVEELDPHTQRVLNLIEYAIGDDDTEWGAKRVADGHKEPFKLEYIAIKTYLLRSGGSKFVENIYNEVGERYPKIKIILDSKTSYYDDENLEIVWNSAKTHYNDTLVSEYYGREKVNLYDNVDRYDFYERSGPKVVVNSFYSNADGLGSVITANNIWSALENSAFLLGLEKNADIVEMASYKTTLSKRNAQTSEQSLIWFDSQDILLTNDYYAQMLFSNNRGTNYVTTDDTQFTSSDMDVNDNGVYQSTTVDTVKKVIYVKLVNTSNRSHKINITVDGFKNVNNPSVQYMTEKFKSAYNDFDEPLHSAPVQTQLTLENNTIAYDIGSYSISVIRIPYSTNDGTRLYELPKMDIISPYVHPAIELVIPITLVVLLAITAIAILGVRISHHKEVKKEKE